MKALEVSGDSARLRSIRAGPAEQAVSEALAHIQSYRVGS